MTSHALPQCHRLRRRTSRLAACVLLAIAAALTLGCQEGGIGMGLPASGARWGGGATGPDVLVAGGPVYR